MSKNNFVRDNERDLVLARLDVMPQNFKLSIGDMGVFNKEELKEHVQKEDEVGKQVIDMQMKFIRDLTSGRIMETLTQNG